MAQYGVYPKPVAELVLETVRYLRESGFVITRPGRGQHTYTPPPQVYVRNDSGEEIPSYACMRITGTVEAGGQNYVKVDKPNTSAALYVFNSQAAIEIGGYGVAQSGPVYRVYKSTGTVTLYDRWRPTASQWYMSKGAGQFAVVGEDDIETNCFKIMLDPSSRLYRFTLNEAWAGGVADADILEPDGTDTTVDDDVRDPLNIFADLTTGDAGWCIYQDGKYWAIQAPCPA